jgi:hypothetical protein
MAGWMHLPRLIDKVRLQQAGQLPTDYEPHYLRKGFDAKWLELANVTDDDFVAIVKASVTDGEVCDWVLKNVKNPVGDKDRFREFLLNYGRECDELRAKLAQRKKESEIGDREDIQCFVDYIDADEGRI